jgi:hypothetical protein
MKQLTLALIVLTVIAMASYKLGKLEGQEKEYITVDKISTRYTKVFGSPETQEEQIIRDYIIYDEPLQLTQD